MSPLDDPRQRVRLDTFILQLLAPLADAPVAPHVSIVRGLLATRYKFSQDDLLFLRRLVCCPIAYDDEYVRLQALMVLVKESAA